MGNRIRAGYVITKNNAMHSVDSLNRVKKGFLKLYTKQNWKKDETRIYKNYKYTITNITRMSDNSVDYEFTRKYLDIENGIIFSIRITTLRRNYGC